MSAVVPYDDYTPPVREPHVDPSGIAFPAMLPIELALGDQPPKEICAAYEITREEFARMVVDPVFVKAYTDAKEMLKKDGMSFRTKAKMQAEALLATSWKLIHHEATPSNVKADLIKSTWRVAGLEPKEAGSGVNTALQINIQL